MAKFEIKDDTQGPWILDLDRLMIDEGIELQRLTGFGPLQWIDALGQNDPKALRFAFYLARKRDGEDIAYKDVNVNIFGIDLKELDAPQEGDGVTPDAGVTEDNASVVPTGQPEETTGEAQISM